MFDLRIPFHMPISITPDVSVSVIIATIRRPNLVLRSIRSVLNQTFDDYEIIVVVDGPDEATRSSLALVANSKLRVNALTENVGAARARNLGMSQARGRWIAFLDDDDEWLPHKLATQVAAAKRLGGDRMIIGARFIEKGVTLQRIMPARLPDAGEPVCEYLFCRKGFLSRSGNVQTSTFFVSRELALQVPFRPEVRSQEDLDWLMRVSLRADRHLHVISEPLAIYHNQETSGREGAVANFDCLWSYALQNRDLFTPRAFSFYLATRCAQGVTSSSTVMKRWLQVYRGMKTGHMTLRTLIFAVLYASLPVDLRRYVRHAISTAVPHFGKSTT
jgi:glycosyltransferase involved in cell wall biosynthesis